MKPNLPDKLYYSIGEVSDAFGVNTSLLRFWEKQFKTLNPQKNSKGDRKYTKKDVQVVTKIHSYVKEKGFTIKGAQEQMKLESKKEVFSKEDMLSELADIKNQLEFILKNLY